MMRKVNAGSENEILRFISRFTNSGRYGQVIETFTHGCCFWFAQILSQRFNGTILFDDVDGHFSAKIGERIYDITGDITDGDYHWNEWEQWENQQYPSGARRSVINGCILFQE